MKNRVLLIALSFILFCSYAFAQVQKNIRIGIILDTSSFTLGSSSNLSVCDSSGKKFKLTKGAVKISCSQNGVMIDKRNLLLPVKIESSNGVIFANSKPYRGCIVLKKSGNKINVINILSIEDYLKGVLPKEVGANWNDEALKVQAVISRTYAIANLKSRHEHQGFDLCSTTHCQCYGGLSVEDVKINQAISQTSGEVLTYEGKPAQTLFHAVCGGRTEDPKHIWGWKETPSYLKGVKCRYCSSSPHIKWKQLLDESFIRNKLKIGKIKKIKIKGKTSSGAAKELEIVHSNGKCTLGAYKFRLDVGPWEIKSHFLSSVKIKHDKIYFEGKGWGHKVGLCQSGAKVMAEKGKTYTKILSYYYPGTKTKIVSYR